jgi:hypothetical protein
MKLVRYKQCKHRAWHRSVQQMAVKKMTTDVQSQGIEDGDVSTTGIQVAKLVALLMD